MPRSNGNVNAWISLSPSHVLQGFCQIDPDHELCFEATKQETNCPLVSIILLEALGTDLESAPEGQHVTQKQILLSFWMIRSKIKQTYLTRPKQPRKRKPPLGYC